MADVMVYEIASSAAANAKQLFSPDRRFFYWNEKKFVGLSPQGFAFFVNRTGGHILWTVLDQKDIPVFKSDETTTNFVDEGTTFEVSGKYPTFVRFKILDRVDVPADWKWSTLGSAEATYLLRGENKQNESIRRNNVARINQLLKLFDDQHVEANRLLNECLENLGEMIVSDPVPDPPRQPPPASNRLKDVIEFIEKRGFHFAPWQIACYITALRTKPFVILAGVSGTGKSKLPALVAEATGGRSKLIPVRPDWTDSAEVIGYTDLQGNFRPGPLLQFIAEAQEPAKRSTQHVCIVDEMNLARVEHYFAEVLSRIEDRKKTTHGYESEPLFTGELKKDDHQWGGYGVPPNLAIVGTVNMDESTHGFSKKVLDRAFTMELSEVSLDRRPGVMAAAQPVAWPLEKLVSRAIRLGELNDRLGDEENTLVEQVITALKEINAILVHAQLQVGYRTRDEIALFVLHAQESLDFFKTEQGEVVDPLDLALLMKILPRIAGGSSPVRATVLGLLGWAYNAQRFVSEQEAESLLEDWKSKEQPGALSGARFPRMAARLCLMLERLRNDGFTSFWL